MLPDFQCQPLVGVLDGELVRDAGAPLADAPRQGLRRLRQHRRHGASHALEVVKKAHLRRSSGGFSFLEVLRLKMQGKTSLSCGHSLWYLKWWHALLSYICFTPRSTHKRKIKNAFEVKDKYETLKYTL